jgi:hypothetical protein
MTAKAMRQALIDKKGWTDEELPCENTIGNILNRLGYRLRGVPKAKPIKKIPETDAIFDNVHQENQAADEQADCLRISMDPKAKVNVGEYARGGEARGQEATKALDHDMNPEQKLVPFGILEVVAGLLTIVIGTSRDTSDFLADCLQWWWDTNRERLGHVRCLVIDLDNGQENASTRTQFMKRMVEFADHNQVEVKLVYYPPYHSKYNPVEHCWGILEQHWNGTLLDSVSTVLEWAKTMTWKAVKPVVHLLDKVYETGVRLTKKAFQAIEERLERHQTLPKYSVVIKPQTA